MMAIIVNILKGTSSNYQHLHSVTALSNFRSGNGLLHVRVAELPIRRADRFSGTDACCFAF